MTKQETDFELLLARTVAVELILRAILAGSVARHLDPVGEIDRMRQEFQKTIYGLELDADDARSERLRQCMTGIIDANLDAIRASVIYLAERQAARAGAKN